MAQIIDACGRSCPEPVLMTKKALESHEARYEVLVDNNTARQNVTRFAKSAGYTVGVTEEADLFRLVLTKS
ncbi:MAG: sulfurtransferase TusA family protein [Oscillospiraceae bacterium]|nr:sulfurtransferase TusA family protein [Oscillospiraceae bacterium]